MQIILGFLVVGWLVLLASHLRLWVAVRHLTADLTYINTHTTNAGVTTTVSWGPFKQLTTAMNVTLAQTRELQQTQIQHEQRIEQMLLTLTHDIKTPLTVATGYVQLIQQRPTTATAPTLKRILANLSSVNYYLHYLMDFNLVRAKTTQLTMTKVNLSQFVEQELFGFFDELTAKPLMVTPKIRPNLTLITDELLLRRIIQNLVGNWLKYAVATASVTLTKVDAEHVCLTFENQTTTPVTSTHPLTTPFYTTNSHGPSEGLGLNIVQSLTTMLGGRMQVTTSGDLFKVSLTFRTRPPKVTM